MFWSNINLKVEQIYNEFGKLIFSIAYSYTKDYHAAEDISQETIRKIIKNPGKISELEGNELRNYIARIAANASYDYLKKAHKIVLISDEELSEQDIKDDFDLEEFVITNNTKDRLKKEIRELDSKYRDPLILHRLDGHTISEVSDLLSVQERTVKHRINKAIKILNEVLRKGDDDNEQ